MNQLKAMGEKMMEDPIGLNRYSLTMLAWTRRLGQSEPNRASLTKLGETVELLVQEEMLAWANGDYHESDLIYQDETETQLRREVEIHFVQELIKSLQPNLVLTEEEQNLLEADSISARPAERDLIEFLGPQLIEARETGTALKDTALSLTEWFPTEIELVALTTGISMYDL